MICRIDISLCGVIRNIKQCVASGWHIIPLDAELDTRHTMIELLNCDCMEYMATVPDKYFDLAKARFDMATRQLAMSI